MVKIKVDLFYITRLWYIRMRNNSYKLNWFYEYYIQEVNSTKILSKYKFNILIMFGHFKKSASILTKQDTQMVGNDQPATTFNTLNVRWCSLWQ